MTIIPTGHAGESPGGFGAEGVCCESRIRVRESGKERDHIQGKLKGDLFTATTEICPPVVHWDSSVDLPWRRDRQPVLSRRYKNQREQGRSVYQVAGPVLTTLQRVKDPKIIFSPDTEHVQREDGGIVGQPVSRVALRIINLLSSFYGLDTSAFERPELNVFFFLQVFPVLRLPQPAAEHDAGLCQVRSWNQNIENATLISWIYKIYLTGHPPTRKQFWTTPQILPARWDYEMEHEKDLWKW